MSRFNLLAVLSAIVLFGVPLHAPPAHASETSVAATVEHFAPYVARFGRARPVVAVVGHNAGTELTDFVIPYAVLQRSGAVDTFAVSALPGAMTMRPALHLRSDFDVEGFDRRFPEGADYVVVPAVVKRDDAKLLAWIRAQYSKGATVVSICDGALVLANTGLLKGHRATAHWATQDHRRETYPDTTWVANQRYVIDGRLASSAGISAAIPTSLALLESIAGHDRTAEVGAQFGVHSWTPTHDSDAFRPRLGNLASLVRVNATNKWLHGTERLGIPLQPGMDDVALALTADAYSRTGRSMAYGVAAASEIRSRSGLVWLPDASRPAVAEHRIEAVSVGTGTPVIEVVLASVEHRYGGSTAQGVASDFEYSWSPSER